MKAELLINVRNECVKAHSQQREQQMQRPGETRGWGGGVRNCTEPCRPLAEAGIRVSQAPGRGSRAGHVDSVARSLGAVRAGD